MILSKLFYYSFFYHLVCVSQRRPEYFIRIETTEIEFQRLPVTSRGFYVDSDMNNGCVDVFVNSRSLLRLEQVKRFTRIHFYANDGRINTFELIFNKNCFQSFFF